MLSSMTGISHQNYPVQDTHFAAPGSPSPITSTSKKRKQEYPPTAEPIIDLNFTPFHQQSQWDGAISNTSSTSSYGASHQQQEYDVPIQSMAPVVDMDQSSWPNQTLGTLQNNDVYDELQPNLIDPSLEKSSSSFVPFMQHDPYHTPTPPPMPEQNHSRGLTDIHQMLALDSSFDEYLDHRPTRLPLSDQQFMRNWMSESPSSPQSPFSPMTPSFFTPSFLGALQEDQEFSAHPTMDRHTSHFETPSVEQNTIMTPIVAHTTDKPPPSLSDQGSSSSASPNMTSSFDNMNLFSDSVLHSSISEMQMKPLVQKYLDAEDPSVLGEKTVVILTSKVAQKSYGTEKRFLCPPPTAILVGSSWWTGKPQDTSEMLRIPVSEGEQGTLAPPNLSVLMSGETQAQPGQIEWYTVSGATVGQTGHVKSTQQQQEHPSRFRSSESRNNNNIDWYHNQEMEPLSAGKSVSKHLYINDADEKRKRVECLIKLQLANGIQFGYFSSKGIKVISKPSKKRQSVKNMELCIHHGTTVSLFNRIRSQTVSTKYLGVSTGSGSPFTFPGQYPTSIKGEGTCFVARTTCWDPFVIWIVDTTHSEELPGEDRPTHYPPPPAIAQKNKTNQLVPIHYNQHVVLQCLTTGLVSPVMVIRKVDKASTVVGGARSEGGGGGEYGDEMLGDPVSQLHKVALQIVQEPTPSAPPVQQMPKSSHPVTYLACLNDMVGMHRTSDIRKPIVTNITSREGGKVVRKRRVSTDDDGQDRRRRVNSSDTEEIPGYKRHGSVAGPQVGSYWSEDVSDAAVWTIVGTDCATYTFWDTATSNDTLFPSVHYMSTKEGILSLHGENFSRDMQIWFGDVKVQSEYKGREWMVCQPLHGKDPMPLLLVRGDGTICKTNKVYPFI